MITKKIYQELIGFKDQFENYYELLGKIMLRKPEEALDLSNWLGICLKGHPDIKVIDIQRLKHAQALRHVWIGKFRFNCGNCHNIAVEEWNLSCSWMPHRFKGSGNVCEFCFDKFQEYEMDARAEKENLDDIEKDGNPVAWV